jgi:hypothetical protein
MERAEAVIARQRLGERVSMDTSYQQTNLRNRSNAIFKFLKIYNLVLN